MIRKRTDEELTNLLVETIQTLAVFNKTWKDVLWVGSRDFKTTWENFAEVAHKTNYYAGFGHQEIPDDLIVVGKDFWLERAEYDGSEWWAYKFQPVDPEYILEIKAITEKDTKAIVGIEVPIGWSDSVQELNEAIKHYESKRITGEGNQSEAADTDSGESTSN